jgi:hypothetical protein
MIARIGPDPVAVGRTMPARRLWMIWNAVS